MPLVSIVISIAGALVILILMLSCVRQRTEIRTLTRQIIEQSDACRSCKDNQDLMFSVNPHPMWIYDRATLRFLKVNDAAVKNYGYSREEFLAMKVSEIRPEEDVPIFLESIQGRQDGYARPGIFRHRRKDGSIVMTEIMAFQYDRDDSSREMVLALDVTERCRMEQAIRESEATMRILVDKAPLGIAQTSIAGDRLLNANPALLQMLGYSLEEALKLVVSTQLYADPKERGRLLEVLKRNGQVQGWETNFHRRDGTLLPVRISSSVQPESDPDLILASYFEDMTQQTRLEQQVRQVQKLEAVGLAGRRHGT